MSSNCMTSIDAWLRSIVRAAHREGRFWSSASKEIVGIICALVFCGVMAKPTLLGATTF